MNLDTIISLITAKHFSEPNTLSRTRIEKFVETVQMNIWAQFKLHYVLFARFPLTQNGYNSSSNVDGEIPKLLKKQCLVWEERLDACKHLGKTVLVFID